jgi:hypothetical protein
VVIQSMYEDDFANDANTESDRRQAVRHRLLPWFPWC